MWKIKTGYWIVDDLQSQPHTKMFGDLMWPLELNNKDKALWNDKYDYYELENCGNLNLDNFNLITLQLNIRGLLAHELELKQLLHNLENRNTPIDILLLCETFLSKKTEHIVNIPGYNLISNCRMESKGGGVCILLKKILTTSYERI